MPSPNPPRCKHRLNQWKPKKKRGERYPWRIVCECGDEMDTTLRIVANPIGAKPKMKEPFE